MKLYHDEKYATSKHLSDLQSQYLNLHKECNLSFIRYKLNAFYTNHMRVWRKKTILKRIKLEHIVLLSFERFKKKNKLNY